MVEHNVFVSTLTAGLHLASICRAFVPESSLIWRLSVQKSKSFTGSEEISGKEREKEEGEGEVRGLAVKTYAALQWQRMEVSQFDIQRL